MIHLILLSKFKLIVNKFLSKFLKFKIKRSHKYGIRNFLQKIFIYFIYEKEKYFK